LVAQLRADLCGNVGQFIYILYRKSAPAGQFGYFCKQRGTAEFLRCPAAIFEWVKYADRVQLGIRLSYEPLDILLVVPTNEDDKSATRIQRGNAKKNEEED
jgi:hypothetical protein